MRKIALIAALLVSGCAYKAEPVSTPAHNLVTSYTTKIPGKYLLYVEADALRREIKPSDFQCAGHRYPVDLQSGFKGTVVQTLRNLFEEIEEVPSPVGVADLAAKGAKGIVVVRGESMNPSLRVMPGFWSASMESRFEVVASVYVDKRKGRVFGRSFEGTHIATTGAGLFCEGGAQAITESSQEAMKKTVRRMAEGISNSQAVRK